MNRSRNESYGTFNLFNDGDNDLHQETFDSEDDDEYIPLPPSPKKTKRQYNKIFEDNDDFPAKYRYPRDGPRRFNKK